MDNLKKKKNRFAFFSSEKNIKLPNSHSTGFQKLDEWFEYWHPTETQISKN